MKLTRMLLIVVAMMLIAGTAAAELQTMKVAYPFWPGFAPVHLASELGYFEEEGLVVEEIFDDDRTNVFPAMERGDIDLDMRTVGEHQGRPRTAESQGTIIGTIDVSLGGDGVVVEKDIKTMADLKGKVFAAEPNIPARLLAQMGLKEAGLSLSDVTLKEISTADAAAVFADDSVAGVAVYEPTMTQMLKTSGKEGSHIIISSKDYPGLITDVIVARTENLKKNPEKFAKFLRAVYRAIDYFGTNRTEAVKLMAPNFKLTAEEFEEVLTGLEYTPYEQAVEFMGKEGQRGKLHPIFKDVMLLNMDYGASDEMLDADQQIDNTLINSIFDGHKR